MQTIYNALLPIIILILLGYGLQRSQCFTNQFWSEIEKITYYILTPALLIHALADKPLNGLPWQDLFLTLDLTIFLCTLLMIVWQRWGRPLDAASFTSQFQGGIRFNTFIALALADALFGEEGLLYGAIASVAMIILINILCVTAFAVSVPRARFSLGSLLRQLTINPLILGCVAGLGLNLSGINLPDAAKETFALAGRAAFPIGLLAVGAGLKLRSLTQDWELNLTASAVQFLVKPFLAVSLSQFFGLNGLAAAIVILFLSVPTAPSAYILSRQLGGNYQAMAAVITFQTLVAFITLPVTLWLLGVK
ncbi:MAG: AEC family transporter [Amphritea sp.]